MKLLLDVKNDKAAFVSEVLRNFKFVKTKILTDEKCLFLSELKESVDELNLIKTGKAKGRPAEELLKEL